MLVTVDGWAWVAKESLTFVQLQALKKSLTVRPRKVGDHPGDPPKPIKLYEEQDDRIGIAREYFFQKSRGDSEVELQVSNGTKASWPGPIVFNGALRDEQERGVAAIVKAFRGRKLGGILRAPCGFGKTVVACAIMARLDVPTLVVVHKEFLLNQWRERIAEFLPDAKIGHVQQKRCEFVGKHVAIAMVHSLANKDYGEAFRNWPGLIIVDETHRIGASTWAPVPSKFPAKWRLGITATPRRKDGADNVFKYQIGQILFTAKEDQLKARVRRVWSTFKMVKTPRFNPNLAPRSLLIRFLCASKPRNRMLVEQLILALKTGRTILVLSERLKHLDRLNAGLFKLWDKADGPIPGVGFYVGGMSENALRESSQKRCIFATKQMASEGLDIPQLDTLVLATPMSDIEQARGRILRPLYRMGQVTDKKTPIIVDIRDDRVKKFKKLGDSRDRQYQRLGDT
jgi:superfamily II DNA or RNA helicase